MMRCQKIILELSNYLDNEMDNSLRLEFEEHMGRCPNCRVIIDTTRRTIEVYRGCEPVPLPESLHNKLRETLHRRYNQKSEEPSD
jgi:anti-sigma factor RsiW